MGVILDKIKEGGRFKTFDDPSFAKDWEILKEFIDITKEIKSKHATKKIPFALDFETSPVLRDKDGNITHAGVISWALIGASGQNMKWRYSDKINAPFKDNGYVRIYYGRTIKELLDTIKLINCHKIITTCNGGGFDYFFMFKDLMEEGDAIIPYGEHCNDTILKERQEKRFLELQTEIVKGVCAKDTVLKVLSNNTLEEQLEAVIAKHGKDWLTRKVIRKWKNLRESEWTYLNDKTGKLYSIEFTHVGRCEDRSKRLYTAHFRDMVRMVPSSLREYGLNLGNSFEGVLTKEFISKVLNKQQTNYEEYKKYTTLTDLMQDTENLNYLSVDVVVLYVYFIRFVRENDLSFGSLPRTASRLAMTKYDEGIINEPLCVEDGWTIEEEIEKRNDKSKVLDKFNVLYYRGTPLKISKELVIPERLWQLLENLSHREWSSEDRQAFRKRLPKRNASVSQIGAFLRRIYMPAFLTEQKENENLIGKWGIKGCYDDTYQILRKQYVGGFTYVNPIFQGRLVPRCAKVDVNGMYSAVMSSAKVLLPIGEPSYKPLDCANPYMIYRITIKKNFKCTSNGYAPMLPFYLKNNSGEITKLDWRTVLTKGDYYINNQTWEWMCKNYKFGRFAVKQEVVMWYIGVWADKLFTAYVKKYSDLKEQNAKNPIKKQYFKLLLNSLYGKFGTSLERENKVYLPTEGEYITHKDTCEGEYYPLAGAITASARLILANAIGRNMDKVVYCDTDSIIIAEAHNNLKFFNIEYHDTKLGAFKLEKEDMWYMVRRTKQYFGVKGNLVNDKWELDYKTVDFAFAGLTTVNKSLVFLKGDGTLGFYNPFEDTDPHHIGDIGFGRWVSGHFLSRQLSSKKVFMANHTGVDLTTIAKEIKPMWDPSYVKTPIELPELIARDKDTIINNFNLDCQRMQNEYGIEIEKISL